jgi:predicted nucleic acid-binding protein
MRFWDSSAIVPLCLDEPQSDRLKRLAEEDAALVVWWTGLVECYSAFARLRREGVLSRTEEDQARLVAAQLQAQWTEIEPSNKVRAQAERVLLLHPLRAADSLQLAAALVWAAGHPTGHEFVCLDQRLCEAAGREGFRVLNGELAG